MSTRHRQATSSPSPPSPLPVLVVSPPGPLLQRLNSLLHPRCHVDDDASPRIILRLLAETAYAAYWTITILVGAQVAVLVLLLRTVRTYYVVLRGATDAAALALPSRQKLETEQQETDKQPSRRMMKKTKLAVVVTGCDSGIGHEIVVHVATPPSSRWFGCREGVVEEVMVFAGCLHESSVREKFRGLSNVCPIWMDVTRDDHVREAACAVERWLDAKHDGEVDTKRYLHAVVNNAGIGIGADADWLSLEQVQLTMDVNFTGVVRVCKAFLPVLKRQAKAADGYERARILNVTSMAGLVPAPAMMGAYGASKHAAQCWSEALRMELAPWRIQVATVNPTFHKTPLVKGPGSKIRKVWDALPDESRREYGDAYLLESQVSAERLMAQTCWNLEVVVDEIIWCLVQKELPMRVVVGMDGKFFTVALRMLPGWLIDWILAVSLPPRVPLAMKEREVATQ